MKRPDHVPQRQSWDRMQQSVPRTKFYPVDSPWKSVPLSERALICPGLGSYPFPHIHAHVPCPICLSPCEPDMSRLLTSALFKAADLKISRQEQGWCCW